MPSRLVWMRLTSFTSCGDGHMTTADQFLSFIPQSGDCLGWVCIISQIKRESVLRFYLNLGQHTLSLQVLLTWEPISLKLLVAKLPPHVAAWDWSHPEESREKRWWDKDSWWHLLSGWMKPWTFPLCELIYFLCCSCKSELSYCLLDLKASCLMYKHSQNISAIWVRI